MVASIEKTRCDAGHLLMVKDLAVRPQARASGPAAAIGKAVRGGERAAQRFHGG